DEPLSWPPPFCLSAACQAPTAAGSSSIAQFAAPADRPVSQSAHIATSSCAVAGRAARYDALKAIADAVPQVFELFGFTPCSSKPIGLPCGRTHASQPC